MCMAKRVGSIRSKVLKVLNSAFLQIPIRPSTLLSLLCVLVPFGNSCAEPGKDSLQRQLEMGLHEQLCTSKQLPQSELMEFTTDGCSGGLSVGWEYLATKIVQFQTIHGEQPPWQSCCVTHDLAYHSAGGRTVNAERSYDLRKDADRLLQACVVKTGTERVDTLSAEYHLSVGEVEQLYEGIAGLMYRAVRIGGMPCTGLPWRWGYGWPECL